MEQFVAFLGLTTLSSCLVLLGLWLSREWLLIRLKDSIKHEYDKKLEEYKYRVEIKKRAEMVARLLAHWLSKPEQVEELNRMAFECYLWLPDDVAKELADLLAHNKPTEIYVHTVLINLRKHLHADFEEYQKLTKNDLTIFRNL